MEKNLPEKDFRAGPVRATVWKNVSKAEDGRTYSTVSIERSYKDQNGEWQKTTSLRLNDLPKASLVLSKAYEYLTLQKTEAKI